MRFIVILMRLKLKKNNYYFVKRHSQCSKYENSSHFGIFLEVETTFNKKLNQELSIYGCLALVKPPSKF